MQKIKKNYKEKNLTKNISARAQIQIYNQSSLLFYVPAQ